MGLALWKCSSLGLLPITVSDWAVFETVGQPIQYGGGSYT